MKQLLNTQLVWSALKAREMTQLELIQHMGLARTAGYAMLRDGILPKDQSTRGRALKVLSKVLGIPAGSVLRAL